MRAAAVIGIEKNVDRTASAIFAGACGYAGWTWLSLRSGMPLLGAGTAAAVAVGYLVSVRALGAVKPEAGKLPIPVFDLRSIEPMDASDSLDPDFEPPEMPSADHFAAVRAALDSRFETDELLLIEHFNPAQESDEEPLLLDDILAELGPDSRVVRLFDPEAMPTPGELKTRIDRHIAADRSIADAPDAGEALHDALAELRRSIR